MSKGYHKLKIYYGERPYFNYHNYKYYFDELLKSGENQVFWRGRDWYITIIYSINDYIILSRSIIEIEGGRVVLY